MLYKVTHAFKPYTIAGFDPAERQDSRCLWSRARTFFPAGTSGRDDVMGPYILQILLLLLNIYIYHIIYKYIYIYNINIINYI